MKSGEEVIKWIHGLLQFGIRPGLDRMESLLEKLGHPERKLNVIHVAGTNGKGSTVSLLRHVYEQGGYKVGTFTSPYIEHFEERISLNGQPISEEDLVYCANKVRRYVDEFVSQTDDQPTEFEVITLIAFVYFAQRVKPDLVLLEVGLGGRLDSTNVVTPLVSIITSIGYDHMNVLGDTLEEITFEKAGIIKKGGIVVSGVKQQEAKQVIEQVVKEQHAEYYQLGKDFTIRLHSSTENEQQLHYSGEQNYDVGICLKGPHQRDNTAVALQTVERLQNKGFPIDEQVIKEGLKRASWIGRFEVIQDDPPIVLDGAHNAEGILALAETLDQHYPNKMYHFVFAMTKEKDVQTVLKPLDRQDCTITFTTFDFFRAAKANDLFEKSSLTKAMAHSNENWKKAFIEQKQRLNDKSMLIVCGSLYFISEVRNWLKEQKT